ncbi:MAG: tetratricopeptide repeat protein [Paraburkholderia sp.]|uniref:tetratricopeptide repeat protein n=1 Tax=Paraburkholderia sp. TaxID=1926495 RepID=UPI003C635467
MTIDTVERAEAAFQQGFALHQQWRLDEAEVLYRRALESQPEHFHALHLLGLAALQKNQVERAVELIGRAATNNPRSAEAHNNLGNALTQLGRFEAAITSYDKAIEINRDYVEAYLSLAYALRAIKQYGAAIASYDRAIAIRPDHADAYTSRGNALRALRDNEAAIASYEKAIALRSDNPEAYNNRGNALRDLKRFEAAIASYDKVIALKPNSPEAYNNRGNALRNVKRYEAAVASYDEAIALKPDYVDAHNNRGTALADLKQYEAALASYDRATALKPDFANAHNNRGTTLADLKQYEAAIASYDRAISLAPNQADALHNRGNAFRALKDYEAAVGSYARALALEPDSKALQGMCLHTRMQICDWRDLEVGVARFTTGIEHDKEALNPFLVLTLSDSVALHSKTAEIWAEQHCPANSALSTIPRRPKRGTDYRIRIGYFSADYHNHATSYLVAGLFEMHNRSQFEVTALSFGLDSQDAMRKRLEIACEHFIDVRHKSDLEVASLARDLKIDIAVDLKGFTQDNRAGIFALRAAPLQVNYLGFPGTMNAGYMDYLVGDVTVIPKGSELHYREKIIYMPHCYQVNDAKRSIADKVFTRAELGLPKTGFVFCCFNNSYKITPGTFDSWMRILSRVGGVLWLLEDNPSEVSNLRQEAVRRSVDAERLIFAKRTTLPEHLARQRAADLILDTLPYNAHTTASDALWVGVPVLTCAGHGFAGRVAASLLTAVGLPELITSTSAQYEDLAVALASNSQHLAAITQKLAGNRLTTPLFDTRLYTKHLEAAYTKIFERYHADLPTEHIVVESKFGRTYA